MVLRLLIDAVHPDETRVVIAENSRIHDFDFVTSAKKQVKGNIYLAKITRVEPSLQAAFVEYGGGKQGFLPFAEIHPDYYQIPVADRQRLMAEVEEDEEETEESLPTPLADELQPIAQASEPSILSSAGSDSLFPEMAKDEPSIMPQDGLFPADPVAASYQPPMAADMPIPVQEDIPVYPEPQPPEIVAETNVTEAAGDQSEHQDRPQDVETLASDEDAVRQARPASFYRRYKIQEVIKRNQIVLVQVIKEERGNKGVSLTTFISLAGRYCVLMPNSPKGGGISRKIMSGEDRKRLKEISAELKTARGMSAIIRTAGIDRTRAEIKRDYEYLVRLWESIREQTLSSTAPALIYEEGDLIKRTIRDLYTNDIEEVIVEGEEGYSQAKEFMKTILPASAAHVKLYKDNVPLFYAYSIEDQLSSMYDPIVKLRSGGYIVLNPTEALISIDVNSGRMTGERNIEETATKTNLEAVLEIARQLRLRDLAGLIVIDLIDMMDSRNRRTVERALKDALKLDRAKIQLGRISPFGLLEMSRQRLRPSLSETSSMPCPHCQGKGLIRSDASVALQVVRAMEKEAASGALSEIRLTLAPSVALHLLNARRDVLSRLEQKYEIRILVSTDAALPQSQFRLEKIKHQNKRHLNNPPPVSSVEPPPLDVSPAEENAAQETRIIDADDGDPSDAEILVSSGDGGDAARGEGDRSRRRGRRGGRGRQGRNRFEHREQNFDRSEQQNETSLGNAGAMEGDAPAAGEQRQYRNDRGERGGRRRRGGRNWRENRNRQNNNGSDAPTAASTGSTSAQPRAYVQPASAAAQETPRPMLASSNSASIPPLSEQAAADAKPKKGWWRRIVES